MAATINQTNKGALMSLKGYISIVSTWGFCFKPLRVVLVFCLHLYLFWWGYYLGLTLVSISISTSSTVPTCLILVGYVCEICIVCLLVQFLKDICTTSNLYRICAYIFNSYRICAQDLHSDFLTCIEFHACMFNSRRICVWILCYKGLVPTYSIPGGYVHHSDLDKIYACIINFHRICSQGLYSEFLTCLTIFGWKIHCEC